MPASTDSQNADASLDKWEDIGYHRIIGGFFYMIIYAIFAFGYVFILPFIIPYSESLGMYQVVSRIFASIFTFADFGLASSVSRFIAEYRVKDPVRTQQYIRFFIWFQSFTGLIQTTGISIIGLYFLKDNYLSYLPWIFILYSIVQYPGWLGVFSEALKGFHQFDKLNIVGIVQGIVLQNLTLFIGAQAGVAFGNANPSIGPVMGAAMGITLGYYIDDFFSMLLAGWLFSKVSGQFGFKVRDVFRWDVPKDVMKESILFGLGVMGFVLSYEIIGSILVLIYAAQLPGYSYIIGTMSIISPIISLAEQINSMHFGNHRPSISEAFFNKKQHYAEYVLSNGFRTTGQISGMIVPLVLVIGPAVILSLFPQYYEFFKLIFIYQLLYSLYFQHSHYMNEVLIGTGNHKFNIIITIVENIVKLIVSLIFIYLKLGIFVIIYANILATLSKQGIGWIYITRKIINLHFNPWQMWIVPLFSGIIYYFIIKFLFNGLNFIFTNSASGISIVSIILIVFLGIYVLPGPCYFLFLGLFGGYDELTLKDMEKAVKLAGLSKIIVVPWYYFAKWGCKSPLYNKVPMYANNVEKEIRELMEMKKELLRKQINDN